MAAVWEQTKHRDDEAIAEYTLIAKAVRSAESRLRRSLKLVESASADEWPRARAALAANYEAYAQSIAQAERLVTADRTSQRRAPHPR